MSKLNAPVIIIKKIKKIAHGGHHGGGWKVAYADFVTAMMAFFLLMWLLNATTEEQRKGISNYFGAVPIGSGGSGGVLGGLSLEKEGTFNDSRASAPMDSSYVKKSENDPTDSEEESGEQEQSASSQKDQSHPNQTEAQKLIEKFESEKFREAEQQLRQAVQQVPDLKDLAQNLIIDQTPEGLRIQIVDQQKLSMFPNGSAEMYPYTRKLLHYVEKIIEKLPNRISITGHTDAKPYGEGAKYTNWELSSDRANATRRVLLEDGLKTERLLYVAGRADTEPLKISPPSSDQNRRISIVLHRTEPQKSINSKK